MRTLRVLNGIKGTIYRPFPISNESVKVASDRTMAPRTIVSDEKRARLPYF